MADLKASSDCKSVVLEEKDVVGEGKMKHKIKIGGSGSIVVMPMIWPICVWRKYVLLC